MIEESFQEYIDNYKKFPLKEKQSIVIEQLKVLTTLTNTMCKELNIKNEILINKEMIDMNKDEYTEDDFAEAIIVYINSIQNSICDFDLKLTEMLEKLTS